MGVPSGLVEAAKAMGSGTWGVIFRVYLKEGAPAIARGATITLISLIGLTAMAGYVGAGGLGILIDERIGWRDYNGLGTVLLTLFVAVFIIENLSQFLRSKLS